MGDFPNLTACLNCRILYKPEQLRGPNCVKCGAKLQEAPEAIVRAKHRAKKKRRLEKKNSDPAATRKDKTLGRRSTTQKVDMPNVAPPPRSRFQDKDSDSDSLNVIKKVATTDELLSALESAPIPDEKAPRTPKAGRDRGRAKKKRSKKPDGSLFIPLDTFVDKRGEPGIPGIGGTRAVPADLFGASGQIGDSGITAQTEKARRGQLGDLEENVHFGDYELNQVLGRGGMGVVYKATQRSLGREVALKLMSSQNIADEDRIRFQREAKAAARLHHPNIVPIFDIGQHNGHDYFTLELIDGQDLHKLAMERQITERDAMEAVRKIALAIHYAHEQDVIHRDIKPHNILIDKSGEPHVTDFGLAKDLQDAVNLTTAGIALGSPPYMPPEQAMGKYDQVDAVSDV
ncbi:MAG: serine/threonine-protein kinase, partial [Planctomycetota bacterium]|nr:serine/threonine-protein kinase [Planctomycetota bacterium]